MIVGKLIFYNKINKLFEIIRSSGAALCIGSENPGRNGYDAGHAVRRIFLLSRQWGKGKDGPASR